MFTWHSFVFVLPILLGLVLLFGSAFGLHDIWGDFDVDLDADADVDVDADADADADGDHDLDAASLLSLLGVGRVPLALLITTSLFCFGGTGMAVLRVALDSLSPGWALGLALAVALVTTPIATGVLARVVARFVPATETYAGELHELIGSTGKAELEVGRGFGIVSIVDTGGAQFKVRCRTEAGTIAKGEAVLVTDYDESRGEFVVEKSPF